MWLQTESGADVHIVQCDVSDETSVVSMLQSARKVAGHITGVIHCAGVIRDGLIRGGGAAAGCAEVWNSKALSAWWLHKHTLQDEMETFIVLSSIAVALGGVGQSAYGLANRFLDELMQFRATQGLCGCSVQLPAVFGVGMAAAGILSTMDPAVALMWSLKLSYFTSKIESICNKQSSGSTSVLILPSVGIISGLPPRLIR